MSSHFWIGKRGSDDSVCEECGLITTDIVRADSISCTPGRKTIKYTHEDRSAFEQVIKNDPVEETPRVVFADWLDEHDDPQYAKAMRCTPQWVAAAVWNEPPDVGEEGYTNFERQWNRLRVPEFLTRVKNVVLALPMRDRCVLWYGYLRFMFVRDCTEQPPTFAEILTAFPDAKSTEILDRMISVLQESDPVNKEE